MKRVMSRVSGKIKFLYLSVLIFFILYIMNNVSNSIYFGTNSNLQILSRKELLAVNKFQRFKVIHIPLLYAKDMEPYYAEINSSVHCLHEGIDFTESKQRMKCICLVNWFGSDCGIPSSVWKSNIIQERKEKGIEISRRDRPRRIILSVVIDDAFDLLDINIGNLFSAVDLVLIAERKGHNDSVLARLKFGYLAKFQSKIEIVEINESAPYVEEFDRIASMLKELWVVGWKILSDFRIDDIILFTHSNSIISKDVILFLKLYDGYTEPFNFKLRPLLFKFSKVIKSRNANFSIVPFKPLGCTVQFMLTMCDYSVSKFMDNMCLTNKLNKESFEKHHWTLMKWTIGTAEFPSGWQCNFCCNVKCIVKNMEIHRWLQNIVVMLSLNITHLNETAIEQSIKNYKYSGNILSYETVPISSFYYAPKVIYDYQKYAYMLD